MNSGHEARVVPFIVKDHPNAEKLALVDVGEGRYVVINKEDWLKIGGGKYPETAIWIQPDSLVDVNREEFSFLKK